MNISYNATQIKGALEDSIFWPNLFLLAEVEKEGFADVEVITSEQYRQDVAIEMAFDRGATLKNVQEVVKKLLTILPKQQFVEVLTSKVRVVINVDRIDDRVIQRSITMLTHVQSFVPGERISFNELEHCNFNKIS